MTQPFLHRRQVEFAETDMAGLVHFSNFFRYVEAAEAALFDAIDWPLIGLEGEYFVGWPRVRAQARFHRPLYFRDWMEIELTLARLRLHTLDWRALIFREQTDGSKEKAATLEMSTSLVRRPATGGPMQATQLPPELVQRLTPYAETVEV